jgi:hypothetical protein
MSALGHWGLQDFERTSHIPRIDEPNDRNAHDKHNAGGHHDRHNRNSAVCRKKDSIFESNKIESNNDQ